MSAPSAPKYANESRPVSWLPDRRQARWLIAGMLIFCHAMTEAVAQSAPGPRMPADDPYAAHIAEASHRFRIPQLWIRAVMHIESARDPRAVSRKGAVGLMQIMPETWAELRLRHQLGRDPYDPHDNILAGTAYLRELYDRYGSPGFLAAYNAGPARYEASLKGRPLPAETRAYVAKLRPLSGGGDATGALTASNSKAARWKAAPLFTGRSGQLAESGLSSGEHAAVEVSSSPLARELFAAGSLPRQLFTGSDLRTSQR
ncbi:lytic transglycosylase domain-containing protein [Mesorhizobium sp. CA7]|uniref:lytic transglycosylase domain-containing protein n=1 Tax=Mesorhizobium sp. CA7 TaxID=588501 RepID=UPI001CCF2D53|nr:lytic transglycosylase domain-containing protein [Mesorhizobium sp. CA7]MBZ9815197.1 lytic transglycosylase domain-containing protein [Mesorhizobium sp. CA7]